jgi:hypothetical protein
MRSSRDVREKHFRSTSLNRIFMGWRCVFYPESNPGELLSGAATTFGQARRLREGMAALKRSN